MGLQCDPVPTRPSFAPCPAGFVGGAWSLHSLTIRVAQHREPAPVQTLYHAGNLCPTHVQGVTGARARRAGDREPSECHAGSLWVRLSRTETGLHCAQSLWQLNLPNDRSKIARMSDIKPGAEPTSIEPTDKLLDLSDPEQVERARKLFHQRIEEDHERLRTADLSKVKVW